MFKKILLVLAAVLTALFSFLSINASRNPNSGAHEKHTALMQYEDSRGEETFVTIKASYNTGRSGIICDAGEDDIVLYPVYDCCGENSSFVVLAYPISDADIQYSVETINSYLSSERYGTGYDASLREGYSLRGTICDIRTLAYTEKELGEIEKKLISYAEEEYLLPGNSDLFSITDASEWAPSPLTIYVDGIGVVGNSRNSKAILFLILTGASFILMLVSVILIISENRGDGRRYRRRGGLSFRSFFILLLVSSFIANPVLTAFAAGSTTDQGTLTPLEVFDELLPDISFTKATLVSELAQNTNLKNFKYQIAAERTAPSFNNKRLLSDEAYLIVSKSGIDTSKARSEYYGTDLQSATFNDRNHMAVSYNSLSAGGIQIYLVLPTTLTSDFSKSKDATDDDTTAKFQKFVDAWENTQNKTLDNLISVCNSTLKGITVKVAKEVTSLTVQGKQKFHETGNLVSALDRFDVDGIDITYLDEKGDTYYYQFSQPYSYRLYIDEDYVITKGKTLIDSKFSTPVCAFNYDVTVDENGKSFWPVCYYTLTEEKDTYKGKSAMPATLMSDIDNLFLRMIPDSKRAAAEYKEYIDQGMSEEDAYDEAMFGEKQETATFEENTLSGIDGRVAAMETEEVMTGFGDEYLDVLTDDPLSGMASFSLDSHNTQADQELKRLGAGFYSTIRILAIGGMVFSILFGAIKISMSESKREQKDVYYSLLSKAGIAVIIFGFTAVATTFIPVIQSIQGATYDPNYVYESNSGTAREPSGTDYAQSLNVAEGKPVTGFDLDAVNEKVTSGNKKTDTSKNTSGSSSSGSSSNSGPGSSGSTGTSNQSGTSGKQSSGTAGSTSTSCWQQNKKGKWYVESGGEKLTNVWFCDDIADSSKSTWYVLDDDGYMVDSPLIMDESGNYYLLESEHNGNYGSMIYENGTYGGIYVEFNQNHNTGSFGAILSDDTVIALEEVYETNLVDTKGCVFASNLK